MLERMLGDAYVCLNVLYYRGNDGIIPFLFLICLLFFFSSSTSTTISRTLGSGT